MFGITDPVQNLILVGLLVVWACLLFGGFIFGRVTPDHPRRMPRWTRIGSSLVLVLATWCGVAFLTGTLAGGYSLLIAIGMTLGFVGDLFMAKLMGFVPLKEPVLGGIAAFGLGHVAYIVGILRLGDQAGLNASTPRLVAWLVSLFVGVVLWYVVVIRGQKSVKALHWAALPYALLLASTMGCAAGLAVQNGAFIPLALGAALFLSSDLILAGQLFSGLRFPPALPRIDDVIWLTYGPAQMLIVFSVYPALQVLRWMMDCCRA
jgi:hypothetical protein